MPIWSEIARALGPDKNDRAFADELAAELEGGMPLPRTQTSLLKASDAAIAAFYAALESRRPAPRPRSREADSSWLTRSDICWLNVRACAIGDCPGSFVRAAKILPAITSDAVLLAPFHPVQFDLIYAPETMTIVDPALTDDALTADGISQANQLRAFVAACGLLGKCAGYELLPYAAQFSRISMERPQLFRWVALDEERQALAHADPDFPYRVEDRNRDADRVASLAATAKADCGVSTFRRTENDTAEESAAKDKAYYSAIRSCIDHGLWQVPAHARNGVGIPAFLRFGGAGDFPVFAYRDGDGTDVGADAYGVVAPFAFHDDFPVNAVPSAPMPRNSDAVDYYAHVFSYWRDSFGFDFVRYNAVDRVFEEAVDDDGTIPASDRPTPEIVAEAIRVSREGSKGTAAIAARKGTEIDEYAALGFDATMGNEAMKRIDAPLLRDELAFYDFLASRAPELRAASACFAVDVPESAAPRLWGSPLSRVMGPDRMRLRHGMARFLSVGRGRRPLFETMGFQDGSTGLYEAGMSNKGLDWADDAPFAEGYASIERLYARLRPFLDLGVIAERHVEDRYAWWQIRGEGRTRLIVAIASLETAEGYAPGRLSIPIDQAWGDMEGRAFKLPDAIGIGVEARKTLDIDVGFLDFVIVDLAPVFY